MIVVTPWKERMKGQCTTMNSGHVQREEDRTSEDKLLSVLCMYFVLQFVITFFMEGGICYLKSSKATE